MVEYLSLRIIERRFLFFYHWRAINTAVVHLISLNMIQQNHSHLMIYYFYHNHLYYFVHISSIKAGRKVVEDFLLRRIN